LFQVTDHTLILRVTPTVNNDTGATDISTISATLNGNLTLVGRDTATVFFCWGNSDAGATTPSAWENVAPAGDMTATGSFSNTVRNLTPAMTYCYRTFATNTYGSSWSAAPATFATPPLSGPVLMIR